VAEEPLVVAGDLALRYPNGTLALQGMDFVISRSEVVGIVGPSGCGKSTLLRAVAGLLPISGGALTVGGLEPELARRRNCSESFVFQDSTLLPWRSVESNVRLALELRGGSQERWETRIGEALEMVGLASVAKRQPAQLSGGMQMRVSLARALVIQPDLLLLDEPFGALDEMTRERLDEELLALWEKQRWTALAVTHSVHEAVFLSTRILVLSAGPGRVIAEVPIDLPYPRTAETLTSPELFELVRRVSTELREGKGAERPVRPEANE
jgi:NitT/TauT family transport system ATP-binding protein